MDDDGGEKQEKKHKLIGALKTVKDANSSDDYWAAVECLEKMLLNVKDNPTEEKYRKLPIDEPWYVGKVGSLEEHEELMEAAGFYPRTDPEDGKEYYYMEASAEAWEELLLVGTILHKTQQKKKKKKSMSRSSSKKSLKSSSSHHNSSDTDLDATEGKSSSKHRSSSKHSKKSRRASNESSFNDSGASARSLFEDEHEGGEITASESETNRSSIKQKKKKKKKKKSSEDGETLDSGEKKKKKKKSKKRESGSSDDEDGSLKQGASMEASGESLNLDESPKSKKKTIDPSQQSPIKGVTKAKYSWAMATSAVIEANRTNEMAVEIDSDGEDGGNKVEKQVENGENSEDLPLVSPKVSSTAKKDYWKNAATQSLLLAKMKKPEVENDDEEDDEPAAPALSPVQARGKWKGAMAKIKALEMVSDKTDKEPEKEKGRRGLWGRSGSNRSAGSAASSDDDDDSEDGRRRGMRKGGSRRGSRKKLNPEESAKRIAALERGLSKHEIEEHRQMLKEQEEFRADQRKRLLARIKREPGPRWTPLISLVSLLTAAELGLNLGTTSISFKSLMGNFDCCGNSIKGGGLTLGITVPYLALILVEMVMLINTVREARHNSYWDKERIEMFDEGGPLDDLEGFDDEDESYDSEEEWKLEEKRFKFSSLVKYILIVNPFLACLITWVLLYQVSSKSQVFVILGMESSAIFLMFVSVYADRGDLTCCSLIIHSIPLIPFSATCFVVWYYLQKGGICFRNNNFWFDDCGMCAESLPLPHGMLACPGGQEIYQGTYCGELAVDQFCYFGY